MSNLASTWKAFKISQGKTITAALEELNIAVGGRSYQQGNLSRWTRGDRRPDAETRAVMLAEVMPAELAKALEELRERVNSGGSETEAIERIARKLAERLA